MADDQINEYVAHPTGELDIATVPLLWQEWIRIVEEQQPHRFVIDLRDVTFLDSTALGAIVGVYKRQGAHEGDVAVINARPAVLKIFQVTHLDRTFHVTAADELTQTRPSAQVDDSRR